MFHTLHHVQIAGVRAVVPANEIRLEDEIDFYGGSSKKVARLQTMLGMDRRRVCPPDVTASDLCAHAAQALFAAMPEARGMVDALIFVSQMPDWHQPATACELQHRLGLPQQCAAFDVNQGCSGYIYGLWLGSSLVASGAAKHALVLVGDAHSFGRDMKNRVTAPVFGDGGSATLLVRNEQAPPIHFGLGTDGSGFEAIIIPAGKARIPFSRDFETNRELVEAIDDTQGNPWYLLDTFMDGGAVFNFTMDVVPKHLEEMLRYSGYTPDSTDWCILHQANKQIVENVAAKAGFALSKAPTNSFSQYGNLASASIPAALCSQFGNATPPGSLLMCGYGVGLSWASCLCNITNWNCAPVIDYEPDPNRPTRKQRVDRWKSILQGKKALHDQT